MNVTGASAIQLLKKQLLEKDPAFDAELTRQVHAAVAFEDLIALATLRKRALSTGALPPRPATLRVGLVGAYTTYPLRELLELFLWSNGFQATVWTGEYDNYVSEILDPASDLYEAPADAIVVMPSAARCRYEGGLTDDRAAQAEQVSAHVEQALALARTCRDRSNAEVVWCNYPLSGEHDLGSFRTRTLGSSWSFRKSVNLEIGLRAPPFMHICDLEFLSARRGAVASADAKRWFESKQLGSPAFLADSAREMAQVITSLRKPQKKVLVLDLDNTLWGGVIGDDGLDGIELGSTSPRGEAFRALQSYVVSLKSRGVLLAVCSKNDHARAAEAFEKHPEMVLRLEDFVAFKANWEPKSDNLRAIAQELNLGLDSFVFVDDNPAEIEIVRQFTPEVETILLGADPAGYATQVADCRWFEPRAITGEDLERTKQYRVEAERKALMSSTADMGAYLESLKMRAVIKPFCEADVPRITQLINKSNQFNLTTRRRADAEITAILGDGPVRGFTVRLSDRFGDHGLIAIVIGELRETTLEVDTWVMSCRVLKRQVEDETVNAIVRMAQALGARRIRGRYLPTAKNEMVRDLYARVGFALTEDTPEHRLFELDPSTYESKQTTIELEATV